MQRLVSLKLASNFPKKLSNSSTTTTTTTSSIFHFQPHKTVSLTKPPQTLTQNHFFSSFPAHWLHRLPHSWRLQHTLTQKIHGLLSNPLLKRQFLVDFSNTLLRASSKSLSDFRLGFLRVQFSRQGSKFQFNPKFTSPRSVWRSWLRRVSEGEVTVGVWGLIIANAAVLLLWEIADIAFMVKNFVNALINVRHGRLHTLITSAFSHFDTERFIHNMIGLYVFGAHIERIFGPQFLLKLYLDGALGGSVFFLLHETYLAVSSMGRRKENKDTKLGLGADGAVNAIILLYIFLFPKSISTRGLFLVSLLLYGIFLIGTDICRLILGDETISGATQLGGVAVAAFAWTRLRKGRF
ncbi:RHOMBOID-like protein 12, mitochondrial [Prunus avium]|uniref:RHOMBOID-like protein 12, mitochondrial n=1 Tax=Prunus avium TaxID=42229 RepID=A0A6P5TNR4_PRUAV|nr:RHOMBOID-like protein 12, mitochondrial [Prunus avium]